MFYDKKLGNEDDCMFDDKIHLQNNSGRKQIFYTYLRYVMKIFQLKIQHLIATTVSPSLV